MKLVFFRSIIFIIVSCLPVLVTFAQIHTNIKEFEYCKISANERVKEFIEEVLRKIVSTKYEHEQEILDEVKGEFNTNEVVDTTRYPHGEDTRGVFKGGGAGRGVMRFQIDEEEKATGFHWTLKASNGKSRKIAMVD